MWFLTLCSKCVTEIWSAYKKWASSEKRILSQSSVVQCWYFFAKIRRYLIMGFVNICFLIGFFAILPRRRRLTVVTSTIIPNSCNSLLRSTARLRGSVLLLRSISRSFMVVVFLLRPQFFFLLMSDWWPCWLKLGQLKHSELFDDTSWKCAQKAQLSV